MWLVVQRPSSNLLNLVPGKSLDLENKKAWVKLIQERKKEEKPPSPVATKVGFPFAKILRNFCGTKRKIFLSLCISFARKNSNLRNHSQNYPIPLLRNSSFAQFRNFVKIKRLGTVCVSQNSILEKSCFGMSSYWSLLHN